MQLFISYAHADETFVQHLDAALAQHNIEAWYDRKPGVGLQGGQTWQQRLQAELSQRPLVAVVLSPEAVRPGAFVENEYLFALNKGATVVPLLYKDCPLPLALTSLQYIDFVHKSFATACDELRIALQPSAAPIAASRSIAPNPFTDRGRIDDATRFFGREAELQRIFDALGRHECVSIIGGNHTGRSSLLHQIAVQGVSRLQARYAYLTLEVCRNDQSFFEYACERLGGTGRRDRDLRRLIEVGRVILCLDDMERLNTRGFSEYPRSFLRGMANGQNAPLTLVVTSQSPLPDLFYRDEGPGKPSPFHSLFVHRLQLAPFTRGQCDAFLDARLKDTGVAFDTATRDELWALTQGHPYKLQRAAHHRYEAASNPTHDWRAEYQRDVLSVR